MRERWMPFLLVAALGALPGPAPAEPKVLPLTLPSGRVMQTELMVSDADRAMGLMFRPSLPAGRALLFVFDDADFHSIWMKNCKFPIDIVWLDEERRVAHVTEKAPPCTKEPCAIYQPLKKALYVIEMNAGEAKKEKLSVGAEVRFTIPE